MMTLTNEQLKHDSKKSSDIELDDDKLEIQSTLREWGWSEEHINIILEKYYDDFRSENNIGLLSIDYPFEAEAFIKYGRDNVNILKMEIEKYRENKVNANNSLNENELNFNER